MRSRTCLFTIKYKWWYLDNVYLLFPETCFLFAGGTFHQNKFYLVQYVGYSFIAENIQVLKGSLQKKIKIKNFFQKGGRVGQPQSSHFLKLCFLKLKIMIVKAKHYDFKTR